MISLECVQDGKSNSLNPDVGRILDLDEISRSRRLGELEVSNDDLETSSNGEKSRRLEGDEQTEEKSERLTFLDSFTLSPPPVSPSAPPPLTPRRVVYDPTSTTSPSPWMIPEIRTIFFAVPETAARRADKVVTGEENRRLGVSSILFLKSRDETRKRTAFETSTRRQRRRRAYQWS